MRLSLVAALAALAVAAPGLARAQALPACARPSAGLVACVAGKLCACHFDRGGAVSGSPAGYGWDCGTLRPACGDAAYLPATLDAYPYPLPPAIGISRLPRDLRP